MCVYNLLGTQSTLGEPQLADNYCLTTRGPFEFAVAIIKESDTRAIPAADPNNRLEYMKSIVQTANVEGETISLKEVVPFWFAVSSPLIGALLGLLGAWFVAWIST